MSTVWQQANIVNHGTRQAYRSGCRCCPCRAANAQAQAQRRADRRAGRVTRGLLVNAAWARKRLRQLAIEEVPATRIAQQLGLKNRSLRLHPSYITVWKLAKIKRVYDAYMAEGPDAPEDLNDYH